MKKPTPGPWHHGGLSPGLLPSNIQDGVNVATHTVPLQKHSRLAWQATLLKTMHEFEGHSFEMNEEDLTAAGCVFPVEQLQGNKKYARPERGSAEISRRDDRDRGHTCTWDREMSRRPETSWGGRHIGFSPLRRSLSYLSCVFC